MIRRTTENHPSALSVGQDQPHPSLARKSLDLRHRRNRLFPEQSRIAQSQQRPTRHRIRTENRHFSPVFLRNTGNLSLHPGRIARHIAHFIVLLYECYFHKSTLILKSLSQFLPVTKIRPVAGSQAIPLKTSVSRRCAIRVSNAEQSM